MQLAVEAGLRLKKVNTAELSPLETILKYNSSNKGFLSDSGKSLRLFKNNVNSLGLSK